MVLFSGTSGTKRKAEDTAVDKPKKKWVLIDTQTLSMRKIHFQRFRSHDLRLFWKERDTCLANHLPKKR
jgi:hypothetical protein